MRQKTALIPTLREKPAEAEIVSHQLMLRAGLIRQLVSGVYTYLPLGYRVLKRVEQIVREEMDRIGAQELLLPAIHPAELWQETGRYDTYGPELVKLQDRHERDFVLGPTHEEVVTDLMRHEVNSYKKLPLTVYQIQTKYRDEKRPRFGILRSREFLMKDAYSFDVDHDGLERSYQAMYEAYHRIFTRCQLTFSSVEADAGAIGGSGNHEFMVHSEDGEDTIVHCENCGYAANIEKAEIHREQTETVQKEVASVQPEQEKPMEKVSTPDARTVEDVSRLLNVASDKLIKSIVMQIDDRVVLALVRGDHEVNDIKVKNVFDAATCDVASSETVERVTGAPVGFAGPVGLAEANVEIVADYAVEGLTDAVIGANEADAHFIHASPGRDFKVSRYADIRLIQEGDACPSCGTSPIQFSKGMEVGHVFKLNTRYSKMMNATFLNEHGQEVPYMMGCYGIGVSRTFAAIVEQNRDESGIIWPASVAPYHIHLIAVNMKNERQATLAEQLYEQLTTNGWDVLFDDRQERAGVKFKDADLIGIPFRIIVGNKAAENVVEYKYRRSGRSGWLDAAELMDKLSDLYAKVDEV